MTTQQTRPPSSAAIAQTIVETKTDTTEIIKLLTAAGDGEEDRIDQILKALAKLLEIVTAIRDDTVRLASAARATPPR